MTKKFTPLSDVFTPDTEVCIPQEHDAEAKEDERSGVHRISSPSAERWQPPLTDRWRPSEPPPAVPAESRQEQSRPEEERVRTEVVLVEAGLGAQSGSNLLCGLDGSLRGLFVETYQDIELGAAVKLLLHLPGGHEVTALATAELRRNAPDDDGLPGVYLAFDSLSTPAQRLLAEYAEWRTPTFFEL